METRMTSFQSTLPRGERPSLRLRISVITLISIHAPAKGATSGDGAARRAGSDFNPRSREGSDKKKRSSARMRPQFQSTLPRGERPTARRYGLRLSAFQSTLPRGERLDAVINDLGYGLFQSTLPRGERHDHQYIQLKANRFQSTLPRGERPRPGCARVKNKDFNPRSREGSDGSRSCCSSSKAKISIHAPARGATEPACPG